MDGINSWRGGGLFEPDYEKETRRYRANQECVRNCSGCLVHCGLWQILVKNLG